jgi:hypothetical protein
MMASRPTICALLVGEAATEEKATRIAANSRACPYVALYESSGNFVMGVFVLPGSKQWWIEVPAEQPELLGLEKAAVFITDQIGASSPWSRGMVSPELEIAPCGTDCGQCSALGQGCDGCPATVYST